MKNKTIKTLHPLHPLPAGCPASLWPSRCISPQSCTRSHSTSCACLQLPHAHNCPMPSTAPCGPCTQVPRGAAAQLHGAPQHCAHVCRVQARRGGGHCAGVPGGGDVDPPTHPPWGWGWPQVPWLAAGQAQPDCAQAPVLTWGHVSGFVLPAPLTCAAALAQAAPPAAGAGCSYLLPLCRPPTGVCRQRGPAADHAGTGHAADRAAGGTPGAAAAPTSST